MSATELASHNRRTRLAMIARLRPRIAETTQAREELQQQREGVNTIKAGIQQMQRLKHIPGFFPTPRPIVERMIDLAGDIAGKTVLEPSAGKGNIAEVLRQKKGKTSCVELNWELADILRKKGFECVCLDFLEHRPPAWFDFVVMNPPFERRQDVAHIRHAFTLLRPGGRLVALASSTGAQSLASWIEENNGELIPLEAGSFQTSERTTGVNCSILTAEKL